MSRVLGMIYSGHGTGMCLVEDGEIKRAVNLERLTRRKASLVAFPGQRRWQKIIRPAHNPPDQKGYFDFVEVFPELLEYVTGTRRITDSGLDLVVKVPDNIQPKEGEEDPEYARFLETFEGVPTHFDLEHHLCHAYQAYLTSPFEETAILTVDGRGERLKRLNNGSLSTTLNLGRSNRVEVLDEVPRAFTLGGLYATHTRHLGFKEGQEGNTMALASFGNEEYWETLQDLLILEDRGTYKFAGTVFHAGGPEWLQRMRAYCPPREPGAPIEQMHMNLAYGVQRLTEECLINAARGLVERTGITRLAMAGGVALNCVANTRILTESPVEALHVMPNAGDRGLAAGAALYGYHVLLGHHERRPPRHDYLGRPYSVEEIDAAIAATPDVQVRIAGDVADEVAELIARGWIVGWHQGGCEFGPRALGHRSILADPRTWKSKQRLDEEIKRREWFRPYAPSVLAEKAHEYFETHGLSPYMLQAVQTRPERAEEVAGIVHVDGSARIQTVEAEIEPLYHRLISRFYERTGVPIVLNTSFNGYDEPMVETPEDALRALHPMQLDAVVLHDRIVTPA